MSDKVYTIEEIREIIYPIAEKYKLKKVSLFGSYARGEATVDSDVDLYIISSPNSYDGISWGAFSMFTDFEEALGKNVDIVIPKQIKQNWDMLGTRLLFKHIKDDEVILYKRRALQRYKYTGTYDKVM